MKDTQLLHHYFPSPILKKHQTSASMAGLSCKRSENSSVPVCAFKNGFSVNFANETNPKNKTPDRCENLNKFGEIQPQNLAFFQVHQFIKNSKALYKNTVR